METNAPVYVKVQDYDDAVSSIEALERKLKEARDLLGRLNELKAEEDRELLLWAEALDDVHNRLTILRTNMLQ
jgi:hypothetical protein